MTASPESCPARRLLRFHVTNGAISLLVTLLLMPGLVDTAHLHVLAANIVIVVACAAANFVSMDRVVFTSSPATDPGSTWTTTSATYY